MVNKLPARFGPDGFDRVIVKVFVLHSHVPTCNLDAFSSFDRSPCEGWARRRALRLR